MCEGGGVYGWKCVCGGGVFEVCGVCVGEKCVMEVCVVVREGVWW